MRSTALPRDQYHDGSARDPPPPPVTLALYIDMQPEEAVADCPFASMRDVDDWLVKSRWAWAAAVALSI